MKEFIKSMLFGLQLVAGSVLVVGNAIYGIKYLCDMMVSTGLGAIGNLIFGLIYLFLSGFWLFIMSNLRPSVNKGE